MIREIGSHHPDQRYASLEDELLQMINETELALLVMEERQQLFL